MGVSNHNCIIEPRSGGHPVAPGVSPGFTYQNTYERRRRDRYCDLSPLTGPRHQNDTYPRADARGYRIAAAPRLNADALRAINLDSQIKVSGGVCANP